MTSQVKPRTSPILDEGIIYILDRDTVLRLGVYTENTKSEAASFVSKVMYYGFSNVAKMIERRNIFERVQIIESDGSRKLADPDGRPVIYLHMPHKKASGWYYVSNKTDQTPLSFDMGNAKEFNRYYYLVETVEGLVLQEQ